MSAVETLREAARRMRERAAAATAGRWRDMQMGSEGSIVLNEGRTISTSRKPATCREFADAEHIAGADPTFMLAVAGWLDEHIEIHSTYDCQYEPCAALAVARAYLRSES